MPRVNEPEITWTVSIEKANMMLAIIGKQPYDQVTELIHELRQQAAVQLAQHQAAHQAAMAHPAPPANGEAKELPPLAA